MSGISTDVIKGWGAALVGAERALFSAQPKAAGVGDALDDLSVGIRNASIELDGFANGTEQQALQGVAAVVSEASDLARASNVDSAIWNLRDAGARLQLMAGASVDQSAQGVYMLG